MLILRDLRVLVDMRLGSGISVTAPASPSSARRSGCTGTS